MMEGRIGHQRPFAIAWSRPVVREEISAPVPTVQAFYEEEGSALANTPITALPLAFTPRISAAGRSRPLYITRAC